MERNQRHSNTYSTQYEKQLARTSPLRLSNCFEGLKCRHRSSTEKTDDIAVKFSLDIEQLIGCSS